MKIHHIAITVKDLERSVVFYKETLGFRQVERFTKPGWDGEAVVLELGGMRLELFAFDNSIDRKDDLSDFKVRGLKHIAFEVDSVQETYKSLKEKGVDIDEPVNGTTCAWFCFLRDPDGIPLELYEG
jgi:glyoxylase I family protein